MDHPVRWWRGERCQPGRSGRLLRFGGRRTRPARKRCCVLGFGVRSTAECRTAYGLAFLAIDESDGIAEAGGVHAQIAPVSHPAGRASRNADQVCLEIDCGHFLPDFSRLAKRSHRRANGHKCGMVRVAFRDRTLDLGDGLDLCDLGAGELSASAACSIGPTNSAGGRYLCPVM